MTYAAVTTFPNNHFDTYANSMVECFFENWTDIPLFIQLEADDQVNEIARRLQETALKRQALAYISGGFPDEHVAFAQRAAKIEKPEVSPGEVFRYKILEFSHKVFATYEAMKECKERGITKLVWIDADVVTHKPVTEEQLDKWLDGKPIAYLGRIDWNTSETGFIIFDLENGGDKVIEMWRQKYLEDEVQKMPEWTDAYVFDVVISEINERKLVIDATDLSKGATGRDVFAQSVLSEFMVHYKGPRKEAMNKPSALPQHSNQMNGGSFDTKNMGIITKNCVEDDTIKNNVTKNLKLIDNWLKPCKANDEELIIASAGPSLYPPDFMDQYEAGVKVVAVKHALTRLINHGIKPWACILLDPRQHVAEFVEYPDTDMLWFVASMVDPKVTEHLIKCGCKVYGYHASVGAKENSVIPKNHKDGKHLLFEGGSATSTRGISVLEALGFKTMHLYGYDCCYFDKPDLQDRKTNGKLRYEEVTLEVETWGGGVNKRTWWTEGQFLAQVQEYRQLYLPKKELTLIPHGDGIIPWMHQHIKRYDKWVAKMKGKEADMLDATHDINQWLEYGTRDKKPSKRHGFQRSKKDRS